MNLLNKHIQSSNELVRIAEGQDTLTKLYIQRLITLTEYTSFLNKLNKVIDYVAMRIQEDEEYYIDNDAKFTINMMLSNVLYGTETKENALAILMGLYHQDADLVDLIFNLFNNNIEEK